MKPHQERVQLEKLELDEKIEKLSQFIVSNSVFKSLPEGEQGLLKQQILIMQNYSAVLQRRLNLWKESEDGQ